MDETLMLAPFRGFGGFDRDEPGPGRKILLADSLAFCTQQKACQQPCTRNATARRPCVPVAVRAVFALVDASRILR